MPWIRLSLGKFGFGFFKGFPPAFMVGWLYIQWLGFGYFQKQNEVLKLAEQELKRSNDFCGND